MLNRNILNVINIKLILRVIFDLRNDIYLRVSGYYKQHPQLFHEKDEQLLVLYSFDRRWKAQTDR